MNYFLGTFEGRGYKLYVLDILFDVESRRFALGYIRDVKVFGDEVWGTILYELYHKEYIRMTKRYDNLLFNYVVYLQLLTVDNEIKKSEPKIFYEYELLNKISNPIIDDFLNIHLYDNHPTIPYDREYSKYDVDRLINFIKN